jgi:hypothetical protein
MTHGTYNVLLLIHIVLQYSQCMNVQIVELAQFVQIVHLWNSTSGHTGTKWRSFHGHIGEQRIFLIYNPAVWGGEVCEVAAFTIYGHDGIQGGQLPQLLSRQLEFPICCDSMMDDIRKVIVSR